MICPRCQEEGVKSFVTAGPSSRTLINVPTMYDEEGQRVELGIKNKTTTSYSCTRGHRFSETK